MSAESKWIIHTSSACITTERDGDHSEFCTSEPVLQGGCEQTKMGRRDSLPTVPPQRELLVKLFLRSFLILVAAVGTAFDSYGDVAIGQEVRGNSPNSDTEASRLQQEFAAQVQPLLTKYCLHCHNADNMESGVRVDHLTGGAGGGPSELVECPPQATRRRKDAPSRRDAAIRGGTQSADGVDKAVTHGGRSRPTPRNGSVRRLTVAQYRNTLRDLLGLQEDFTDPLPPDGVSKDGFTNQEHSLTLSPLQVEAYFDIAEHALAASIVDEGKPPVIRNFRMEFGTKINPEPCPDKLILGANSELLDNADFVVTEPQPAKPFE